MGRPVTVAVRFIRFLSPRRPSVFELRLSSFEYEEIP